MNPNGNTHEHCRETINYDYVWWAAWLLSGTLSLTTHGLISQSINSRQLHTMAQWRFASFLICGARE